MRRDSKIQPIAVDGNGQEYVAAQTRYTQLYRKYIESLALAADLGDWEKVDRLVENAQTWSRAHRSGNGESTDEERAASIKAATEGLVRGW
jgi:hypothetical protein